MTAHENTDAAPIAEVHVSFSPAAIAVIDLTAGRISQIRLSTEVAEYDCDVLRLIDHDGRTIRADSDNRTHQAAWAIARTIIETDTAAASAEIVRARLDQMIQKEPESQRQSPCRHHIRDSGAA